MDKKIAETHKYSKSFQIVKILSILTLGIGLFVFAYFPLKMVCDTMSIATMGKDIFVSVVIVITALISLLLHKGLLNKYYDTLSTYYYITNDLQTNITMSEAKYLKQIFEPTYLKTDTWVTMKNIVALPEDMRKKAIMDAAKRILGK